MRSWEQEGVEGGTWREFIIEEEVGASFFSSVYLYTYPFYFYLF